MNRGNRVLQLHLGRSSIYTHCLLVAQLSGGFALLGLPMVEGLRPLWGGIWLLQNVHVWRQFARNQRVETLSLGRDRAYCVVAGRPCDINWLRVRFSAPWCVVMEFSCAGDRYLLPVFGDAVNRQAFRRLRVWQTCSAGGLGEREAESFAGNLVERVRGLGRHLARFKPGP